MGFWLTLLVNVAVFLAAEFLRPKPDIEGAKPASLGDFQFPTADEGRAVPIVWGTVRVNGPNIGWFGDLQTKAIKKKVKTGLFSSKNITIGYRYFLGIDFMICRGAFEQGSPDLETGIRRIWVEDEILRGDTESWVASGSISFNQQYFFGGKDEGGIVGTLTVYPGDSTQTQSSYMAGLSEIDATLLPSYRGTAHVVLERMEVGNSARLAPWSFETRRIPNGLNLVSSQAKINGSANPANVIYEILTNSEWGLGITNIDTAQFQQAASVLATEGNGYARIMDRPSQAKQLLAEVQQQIDGFIVQDPLTKSWQLKLVRETDYPSPLTDVPLFDESNIAEDGVEFTRGSWADTTNQVKVQFTDREKEFKSTFAIAQDMANKIIQDGDDVVTTLSMPGIQDRELANKFAWRELRTLSYPLAKGRIKADRSNVTLLPGDLARITWPPFNLEDFFVRINKIQLGSATANEVIYDFVEDIFRQEIPSFADPSDTLWTAIDQGPVNAAAVRVVDLPLGFSEDSTKQQYGLLVARGNGVQATYDIWYKEDSTIPIDTTRADNVVLAEDVSPFTPVALLDGALGVHSGSPNNFNNDSIFINSGIDIDEIDSAATVSDVDTDFSVTTPPNFILIDEEWIFFESITSLGSGQYRLNNAHRGMLDSAPAPHDDNSIVWFVSEGLAEINVDWDVTTVGFSVWAMSNAGGGSQDAPDTSPTGSPERGVVTTQEITKRFEGPCAPVNVSVDGVRLADVSTLGDTFNINWRNRVNSASIRSNTQEDGNDSGISGVTYNVRIYHTGVSPEVLVYNQTGIAANTGVSPTGGTHAVSGYAVDFSPLASPWPSPQPFDQTYRVEIEAQTSGSPAVASQLWAQNFTRT